METTRSKVMRKLKLMTRLRVKRWKNPGVQESNRTGEKEKVKEVGSGEESGQKRQNDQNTEGHTGLGHGRTQRSPHQMVR